VKGPFVEGECLVIQRNFQRRVSDSKSSSGTGVEMKQPNITLENFFLYFCIKTGNRNDAKRSGQALNWEDVSRRVRLIMRVNCYTFRS